MELCCKCHYSTCPDILNGKKCFHGGHWTRKCHLCEPTITKPPQFSISFSAPPLSISFSTLETNQCHGCHTVTCSHILSGKICTHGGKWSKTCPLNVHKPL